MHSSDTTLHSFHTTLKARFAALEFSASWQKWFNSKLFALKSFTIGVKFMQRFKPV